MKEMAKHASRRGALAAVPWWAWVVVASVLMWLILRVMTFTRTLTVTRTYTSGRNNQMFVVADDGTVYRYGNDMITGDWNAAEEWGSLVPGAKVKVRGHGVRVPVLGLFPTVTAIER